MGKKTPMVSLWDSDGPLLHPVSPDATAIHNLQANNRPAKGCIARSVGSEAAMLA